MKKIFEPVQLDGSGCVIQGSRVTRSAPSSSSSIPFFVLTRRISISWRPADFSRRILRESTVVGRGTDTKNATLRRRRRRRGWGTTSAPLLKVSPRGCQANKPGKGEALVANCVLTTRRHKARALIDSLLVYLSLSLTVHSASESRLPKLNGVSLSESTLSD